MLINVDRRFFFACSVNDVYLYLVVVFHLANLLNKNKINKIHN